jgi:hypothetical protein
VPLEQARDRYDRKLTDKTRFANNPPKGATKGIRAALEGYLATTAN